MVAECSPGLRLDTTDLTCSLFATLNSDGLSGLENLESDLGAQLVPGACGPNKGKPQNNSVISLRRPGN